jgi:hypothetical protein
MYCTEVMSGEYEESTHKIDMTDCTKMILGSGHEIFDEVEAAVLGCLRSEEDEPDRTKNTIEKVCSYVLFNTNRIILPNVFPDNANFRPIIERGCHRWF